MRALLGFWSMVLVGCTCGIIGETTKHDAGTTVDAGPQLATCGATSVAPAAPSELVATATSYEVALTWRPSTDRTVVRYRVLSGAAEVGVVTAAKFTHRPAVPGETWTYRVTGLTADGAESAPSNDATVTIPAATPNAIDQLEAGHWYEVPNSHLRGSPVALTAAEYPWLGQGEGLSGLMSDWSSGAFDTQRDRLYVSGGGHNGYFGNEIYGFDLRTLEWVRLTNPDPVQGECPAPELKVNCATHTYDGLEYLPLPFDRFVAVGWDGWPQTALNLDTNRWDSHPDLPQLSARTGANCAYDVSTRMLWYHAGTGALSYWNPANGTWTIRGSTDDVGYYRTGLIDPRRRRYVGVGRGHVETWSIDALGPVAPTYLRLVTTGAREIEDEGNPGAEYDPVADAVVAWRGGGEVFSLDLTSLVWTKHAALGTTTPGPQNVTGTYGRFRYVPSLNVFVVVSGVDENVFVYRLDTTAPQLLRRLDVTSPVTRLEANLDTQLTVNAVFRDGSTENVTSATVFRSLDPSVATVDTQGHVHALSAGHARIQASFTSAQTRMGQVGALDLEVVGLPGTLVLDTLTVPPVSSQVAVAGERRPLQVVGHYHRDSDVFTRDVSCLVSWSSDAPTVVAMEGAGLHALAVGSATLTASLGGVTVALPMQVVSTARALLTTLNFQPAGAPSVAEWAVADDSAFDASRGWGWVNAVGLWTRGDRNARPDVRSSSFVGAMAGSTFRLQVPDGRYHVAAGMGDNTYGGGVARLDAQAVNIVAHVGTGNTAGQAVVEVRGGEGLVLDVLGPFNWLAMMPVNGLDFDGVMQTAKSW